MMVMRTFVDRWLDKVYPPKPFDQQLAEDRRQQLALVDATKASIRRHEFDLHMTLHRIEALDAWTKGNERKELST